MHGGAPGSGNARGIGNSNYRHGEFTCEAIKERRAARVLIDQMREFAQGILQA